MTTLRDLLDASLAYADRDYLVEGERRQTYAEHHRAVVAAASLLRNDYGIGPGTRVGILAANCLEWVVTFWATVSLGATVVGLNGWWSPDEIAYGLADADVALLVGDRARLARVANEPGCPVLEIETALAPLLAGAAGVLPDGPIAPDDPAVILYTSGTTGRPKGAVHSHRNLVGLVEVQASLASQRVLPPGYVPAPLRVFTTSPLFHVSGLHSGVVANLAVGSTIVWHTGRFDPVAAMQTIARERCTSWSTVPTAVWRVVHHPDVGAYDLSSIVHIGGGGSSWSPVLQERMREVFGAHLAAGVGYGLTECTGLATHAPSAMLMEHPTTVGRAVPGVAVEVRDAGGLAVPNGVDGEICIRGPLNMLGYWRNPEATAAAYWPGNWLRTGDIGYLSDGMVFLSTRRHDLILRGGENVYPIEIENVLEGHPDVEECVVVGLPHEEMGQEVAAVVVPRAGADVSEAELSAYVRERLAGYKVPTHWLFRAAPLPRTETGKVLRAALDP